MKKLLFALALLCGSAWAQSSFYQLSPSYPNATLRVCPIGTPNPCPSPSSIFSDSGLTQGITQPVQLGSTGNFGFYISPGQYLIQIGQPYNAGFVISLGGGSGGLPTGLTFVSPTFTISSAGNGNAILALSGNTSGTATFTAPAVAGTATNPIAISNSVTLPSVASFSASTPVYGLAGSGIGIFAGTQNTGTVGIGNPAGFIDAIFTQSAGLTVASNTGYFFANGTTISGAVTVDTSVSRSAAGVVAIGNGNGAGDTTGKVKASAYMSVGTKFTASGCANSTLVGGSTAGTYTSVTAGSCTVTITFGDSATAPTGWVCDAHDLTTVADANNITMGTSTTTTANLVEGTVVANDVIAFKCTGY
jgi:hypothetical protein